MRTSWMKGALFVVSLATWANISIAQNQVTVSPDNLVGSWIVKVDGTGKNRSLIITSVSKKSEGIFVLDAKFGWKGSENPVTSAEILQTDKGFKLSLDSKSGAKVVAEQTQVGAFSGTFVNTSGSGVPMTITRVTTDSTTQMKPIAPTQTQAATPEAVAAANVPVDVQVPCNSTTDQCIQKPNLSIGDRWVYKKIDLYNNQEIERFEQKITGLIMDDVRWEITRLASASGTDVGRTFKRFSNRATGSFSNNNILEGKVVEFLFPLEVGKTWKHAAKWKRQSGPGTVTTDIKAEILGWEDVKVQAGTFKAVKIEHYNNYLGNDGQRSWTGSSVEHYWYAPVIKRFVKEEFVDRNPGGERTTVELVEYEIK